MKINYVSDLHLEFGPMEIEPDVGDVLVLAGDIDIKGQVDWINSIVEDTSPKTFRFHIKKK